jgi:hypothetical protein
MHTETNASVCILITREFPRRRRERVSENGKRSTGDMREVSRKREAIVVREPSVGRNPSEKRKIGMKREASMEREISMKREPSEKCKTGMKREASEKYETNVGRVQRMKRARRT